MLNYTVIVTDASEDEIAYIVLAKDPEAACRIALGVFDAHSGLAGSVQHCLEGEATFVGERASHLKRCDLRFA